MLPSACTKRQRLVRQALQLDASASVDDDNVDADIDFRWNCEDNAGGTCVSRTGEKLELSPFMGEAILFLSPGSLPAGELQETPSPGPEAELPPQTRSPLRCVSFSVILAILLAMSQRCLFSTFREVELIVPRCHRVLPSLRCLVEQVLNMYSRLPLQRVPLADQRGHSSGATTPPAPSPRQR